MAGIFYDPRTRRLHAVTGHPDPAWTLVTHNVHASVHHCRRIMSEWLSPDELWKVDWHIERHSRSA
ncbi:hypothetical protein [Tepidiforma sp.]|jgi:hypothetical protein|uniref:hypothetical protein n=1 Tax=Tepidiforma sp. TaxID=2682230 RepID=UPI0021DCAADC|nr:hypothetical protein [Tepidiforma sp.]MCX7617865.1 hypothetical protein [Tepidiforma sp.]GIW18462.1 MAG: hypothetical protein KatS3mg064_1619 [Tepidiforma sp.]